MKVLKQSFHRQSDLYSIKGPMRDFPSIPGFFMLSLQNKFKIPIEWRLERISTDLRSIPITNHYI